MTLNDIASSACELARKTDADSVTFTKARLKRRLEVIWKAHLWKGSLRIVSVAVDPTGNPLHAEGIVLMPHVIERICGVRSGDWPLIPAPLEAFSRTALDEFATAGTSQSYSILKPVVWCWSAAGGKPFIESSVLDRNAIATYARYVDTSSVIQETAPGVDYVTGAASVIVSDQNLPATVVELLVLTKSTTSGTFYLKDTSASGTLVATVAPTATTFPLRQRLRLVNPPSAATTLKVLGKDRLNDWQDTEDCPLPGADDVLIAFAKADLFERFRQGAARDAALGEGTALLAQLIQVETLQEATRTRLIPDGEAMGINADFASKGYW